MCLVLFKAKLFMLLWLIAQCSVIKERINEINPLSISGHTMQLARLLQKADPFAHGSANQYKVAFPLLLFLQGLSNCFSGKQQQ